MKSIAFVALFICSFTLEIFAAQAALNSCPSPQNVVVTNNSNGDISFDWDDCNSDYTFFVVQYERLEDGFSSSSFNTVHSTISFQNLVDGTYRFYFKTACTGSNSTSIIIQDIIVN